MRNYWITAGFFHAFQKDGLRWLGKVVEVGETLPMNRGRGGKVSREIDGAEFVFAPVQAVNTIAIVGLTQPQPTPPGWRGLFLSTTALDQALDGSDGDAMFTRFVDISNIDEAAQRTGLKHLKRGSVRSIFIGGGYNRIHFVTPLEGLGIVLGAFDAQIWASHKDSSRGVREPSQADLAVAQRAHQEAIARTAELPKRRVPAPEAPPSPLKDGWVTLNHLRELGIKDEAIQRRILAAETVEELYDLVGLIPDESLLTLETQLELRERRKAERKLDLVEIHSTTPFLVPTQLPLPPFEKAMELLDKKQRLAVTLERPAPIRLKGGPGTGKTFTAIMRAGHLLSRARQERRPLRLGFFVFSRDLGEKIVQSFGHLGLDEFFEREGMEQSQRLVVTSLLDWGERFLDLDKLGLEPLAAYRADRADEQRRAALELAVGEARRTLSQGEHEELWKVFDARTRHGLREIEMEISQFIKARDVTDLDSYLAEKRPPNWWLASADKPFRKFIWEIARVYDQTLKQLGFVDADDVVNDCLKEVSKTVWQQHLKQRDGFDYLIVDEAQDFFRNQMSLVSHLVKDPSGLMLCYDEAQAVYSRYPNLRDLGFDAESSFVGHTLDRNYRSTRQITRCVQALFANYSAATLQASWGEYSASGESGPVPIAAGFSTEAAMLDQIRDILREAQGRGLAAADCAVVVFGDDLPQKVIAHLEANGLAVDELGTSRRNRGSRAVTVTNAKRIKGQQFTLCILAGVDRDHVPDMADTKTELQRTSRREDSVREFIVAMSRSRQDLHFVWAGAEPSEFIKAMGAAVERRG